MAVIIVPKKILSKRVKITKDIADKINLMGIPLEKETEDSYEIEVLPNRPDALSVQGFIRALSAFTGNEVGLKKYKINAPEKNFKVIIDESVKKVRPYTVCAIVKNLKFDDEKIREIIDLQEKLHMTIGRNRKKFAIGVYPLEKINLPIKFEARKPEDIKFKPLEFSREINGLQILSQHPAGRDYGHLLEGKEKFPIFVDSSGKILSMPPIINSDDIGKVSYETKNIFIECSGFELEILKKTLNIIVSSLIDLGGEAYAMNLDYGKEKIVSPDFTPEKMKVDLEHVNKLIGLDLKEKDLKELLPKMGYDYSNGVVSIAPWRNDIIHEVDIIEDIAIAYGYDKLIPVIPKVATIGEETEKEKLIIRIAGILTGLGLLETSSYHLIKNEEKWQIKESDLLELENSKTEYKYLRPNLMIPILRIISENKNNEYPQKIFEIGTSFLKDKEDNTETGVIENEKLAIAITDERATFTEIKQILDYLFRMLKMEYNIISGENSYFINGRTGAIIVNEKEIGNIGEVSPEVLKEANIEKPVACFELNLSELLEIAKK